MEVVAEAAAAAASEPALRWMPPHVCTPSLVVELRQQLIEALDIYSRRRLAVLENECALKLVGFLLGAQMQGALPRQHWNWLMDALRWTVDFAADLPPAPRLRVLAQVIEKRP